MAKASIKTYRRTKTYRVKSSDVKSGKARCPVCGKFRKKT